VELSKSEYLKNSLLSKLKVDLKSTVENALSLYWHFVFRKIGIIFRTAPCPCFSTSSANLRGSWVQTKAEIGNSCQPSKQTVRRGWEWCKSRR